MGMTYRQLRICGVIARTQTTPPRPLLSFFLPLLPSSLSYILQSQKSHLETTKQLKNVWPKQRANWSLPRGKGAQPSSQWLQGLENDCQQARTRGTGTLLQSFAGGVALLGTSSYRKISIDRNWPLYREKRATMRARRPRHWSRILHYP